MSKPDLSGTWRGYYTQHGKERPISARFEQEGFQIVGRMNDELTEFESTVSEMAMDQGLTPGADERIVEKIRELCPWVSQEQIRAESVLPSDSLLNGEIEGLAIRFRKTYQGQFFSGYRVGDVRVGITGEDHEVYYQGRISPDGMEIEGKWLLREGLDHDGPRAEGGFYLRRQTVEAQND